MDLTPAAIGEGDIPVDSFTASSHPGVNTSLAATVTADHRQPSIESLPDGLTLSTASEARQVEEDTLSLSQVPENEDHVLFQNVAYLGAVAVKYPRNETEILQNMLTMNNESETAVAVDLLVPRVPQGMVVLYEPGTEDEVAKYQVFRIIFCARGGKSSDSTLSRCFAFTFGHGSNEDSVFLCHAFRCQSVEQVGKVIMCFSSAFRKPVTSQLPQGESVFVFDVCLEVKEDDGKGAWHVCPRESRDCFKLRVNLPKELMIHVLQVSPENPHLSLDKCTGVWLAAGKNVSRADFHLLPRQTLANNGKQFNVACSWDPREDKFLLLNTETPGDHRSHMTIIMDVGVAGFAEPLSFVVKAKARVFPQTEKFWMPGRRQLQETFFLRLLWKPMDSLGGQKGYYSVISLESQSQREGRSQMIAPLMETSSDTSEESGSLTQDEEEPLPSGYGQVSKECSPEELRQWSEVLLKWRPDLTQRPKNLASLIRKSGIPQPLRCEVWQLLSGCFSCEALLDEYKTLSIQESQWETEISKDISRTFPAHEYFKSKGSEGQDQLFRVIKSYSSQDTETGYCQSLSFIAATLLLHMPEEQAYCLLVKVMHDYHMRDLMKCDFEGLRLRFYQLERLLEEKVPDLHYHLRDLGVEMHMFASQWFLTLFTAKFPLFCVFRILDLFLCDGHLVLFQVALGLLRIAKHDLLQLDFEGVLKYFRVSLPKRYKNEDTVCLLIYQAVNEKISAKKMSLYEKEFVILKQQQDSTETPVERLKREARESMTAIMRLERENDQLAHELINGKIQLRTELDTAEDQIELQQKEIARLSANLADTDDEVKRLRVEAAFVKELCRKIECENQQHINVLAEYKQISSQLEKRLEKALKNRISLCQDCRNLCAEADEASMESAIITPDEERIKTLELELARTKLALVQKECYTQELLHQLNLVATQSADQGPQPSKNSWLAKTLQSIKSQTSLTTNGLPQSTAVISRERNRSDIGSGVTDGMYGNESQ